MLPDSLEEAAQLDGAGNLRIFFTIALPMAVPAIIISFFCFHSYGIGMKQVLRRFTLVIA